MPTSRYLLMFRFWHEDFSVISPLQYGMLHLSLKDYETVIKKLPVQSLKYSANSYKEQAGQEALMPPLM